MEKLIFKTTKKDKILNILTAKGFSFAYASKLLRNKDIRVEDFKIKENIMVESDSEITVFYDKEALNEVSFEIIYQDENILIINKPSGIEIEGKDGLAEKFKAHAVHRLDRNTTGIVLLAKNIEAKEEFINAFKNHLIEKKYLAEVVGSTNYKDYLMKAYLVKDANLSQVKIFEKPVKNSVEIKTIFNTKKSNPSSSIVECNLLTGRTHQIRASLAFLGHPIIGDGKYGKNEDNKKFKQKTQKLHCFYLKIDKLNGKFNYLNKKDFLCYPNWQKNI